MSQVFASVATGSVITVFADDHCPPPVHARHRGEDWVARVGFSYADSAVKLFSITPLKNVPRQRVVDEMLGEIRARLSACRRSWWTTRQTACLTNQWAAVPAAGKIELRPKRAEDAKQIADAMYDPAIERLQVTFRDGTTADVSTLP